MNVKSEVALQRQYFSCQVARVAKTGCKWNNTTIKCPLQTFQESHLKLAYSQSQSSILSACSRSNFCFSHNANSFSASIKALVLQHYTLS